ncbi:hypothetical protein V6N12_065521 [Hibiscus sabdariffa]|uniref:Uncharacterized protein n=1 Tax=Hibiscus sabdariffa TaxID=183260 RepID=A0ABR2G9R6_9ROSI
MESLNAQSLGTVARATGNHSSTPPPLLMTVNSPSRPPLPLPRHTQATEGENFPNRTTSSPALEMLVVTAPVSVQASWKLCQSAL